MAQDTIVRSPRCELTERIVTLIAVLVPLAGVITAIIFAWGRGFTWVDAALLGSMYTLTGLGITVGFHRLFTHRSFQTIRPIKFVLAVMGSMSVQGPLLRWVAVHRRHHVHSDGEGDPHSPHAHGGGIRGVIAGFWHAHIGWMFAARYPDLSRYVRDLHTDKLTRVASKLFPVWVIAGLAIPTAVGGLVGGSWTGAFLGFLWGGLVRVFLVHHATWSINSVCHLWGGKPFNGNDESRNNFVCGILGFGEGWHNNHHAFPSSARHGLRWWQLDMSFMLIRVMERLGLAWNVRLPKPDSLAARRA